MAVCLTVFLVQCDQEMWTLMTDDSFLFNYVQFMCF